MNLFLLDVADSLVAALFLVISSMSSIRYETKSDIRHDAFWTLGCLTLLVSLVTSIGGIVITAILLKELIINHNYIFLSIILALAVLGGIVVKKYSALYLNNFLLLKKYMRSNIIYYYFIFIIQMIFNPVSSIVMFMLYNQISRFNFLKTYKDFIKKLDSE